MKTYSISFYAKKIVLTFLLVCAVTICSYGTATYTMSTANCSITANALQFDIVYTNTSSAGETIRFNSAVIRFTIPATFFNSGAGEAATASYVGSADPSVANFWVAGNGAAYGWTAASRLLNITTGTSVYNNSTCTAPSIPAGGSLTIGRFQLQLNATNWKSSQSAALAWVSTSTGNFYTNCATATTNLGKTLQTACTLTTPSGCTAPTLTAKANNTAGSLNLCSTSTLDLTANAVGGTGCATQLFAWSNGANYWNGTAFASAAAIYDATYDSISVPTVAGTYTATEQCSGNAGCAATASSVVVTVNPLPTPTISGNDYFCYGSSTTLNAGSYSSYSWSGGGISQTKSVSAVGNYTVTVTDNNGCTNTAQISVTENPEILGTDSSTNVLCMGSKTGSATVSASGGTPAFSYIWNTGETGSNVSALYAGNYTVTVTDSKGCTKTVSATITQPSTLLTLSIIKTNVRCGGKANGSASALASGGVTSYSYLWDDNSTAATRSNLPQGIYTVTVTDANGCSKTKSGTITQNNPLIVVALPLTPTTATANVSGGVSPYTYSWNSNPIQTIQTATGLITGQLYKVKVTDSKGCTRTDYTTPLRINSTNAPEMDDNFNIMINPNPSNGIAYATFTAPEDGAVSMEVFNAEGQLVNVAFTLNVVYGKLYSLDFNTQSWNAGIYTTRMIIGKHTAYGKLAVFH